MRLAHTRTPGGARLRALREAAGRSQLWVEAEAELGTGYLQRVEYGRVVQPERPTLERILAALGARYSERRQVLELFGYTVSTPPPTADECAWAAEISRWELTDAPFPAYVLDCTHRLIAWNALVPFVWGIDPADPTIGGLAGRSIMEAWFDPESPISSLLTEPELMLWGLVRALRYEMQQFRTEAWYADVIARLRQLPGFDEAWAAMRRERQAVTAARALLPIRLRLPKFGALYFRLSSERFVRDARFRVVYLFPADPATMSICAEWTGRIDRSPTAP
jgi:transcriptional regulator with XRE-family HTH domain